MSKSRTKHSNTERAISEQLSLVIPAALDVALSTGVIASLIYLVLAVVLLVAVSPAFAQSTISEERQQGTYKTKNVIVVMIDGLRWEEEFRSADHKLISRHSPRLLGDTKWRTSLARGLYWRDDPREGREALMNRWQNQPHHTT